MTQPHSPQADPRLHADAGSGQTAAVTSETASQDEKATGGDGTLAEPTAVRTAVRTKVRRRLTPKLLTKPGKKPAWLTRPSWLARPGWLPARAKLDAGRLARPGSSRARELAGRAFGRVTVLPAIFVASWLLTGLPLLLLGDFLPVPMLLISAPLATALSVNVLQRVPSGWPSDLPGKARDRGWMPWFGLFGTAFVAGGFVGWQLAKNSPSVIATRTPGAYFQTGYWLAQHGSLPIPGSLAAFGGSHLGLHLSSIGFVQTGHSVVPAVLSGLPMLLAGGFWTSGIGGGAAVMPVLGGLAIFAFGGLVGRLAGRQWAPAGALVLALTAPELYTSRDAFSEPAVQVLLFGGLCLLIDALTMRRAVSAEPGPNSAPRPEPAPAPGVKEDSVTRTLRLADAVMPTGASGPEQASDVTTPIPVVSPGKPTQTGLLGQIDRWSRVAQARSQRRFHRMLAWSKTASWRKLGTDLLAWLTPERLLGFVGGLALGLTALLSLGSLVYLIPVIAVAGVLIVARRSVGVAFCLGIVIGSGYGIAAGYLLALPWADSQASTLEVIGADAGEIVVVTVMVIAALRARRVRGFTRKALARWPLRWLPGLASLLVLAALATAAARPYFEKVRGALGHAEANFVAHLQRFQGLRVDPTRLYSEDTLYWVSWYAGLATVLLAAFGAAVLVRRVLRAFFSWHDPSGAALNWALPVAIVVGGSAAILWQPFTVPDQPWASRRLVPVVIPGMILLATWAAAWLARRARDRGAGKVTAGFVAAFCVGAMALPAFTTSTGLGLSHSGVSGGFRLAAKGLAQHTVGAGETTAVRGLCAAIGRSSSVVILDRRIAADFTQVIRGMCGVPVAWMPQDSPTTAVDAVLSGIARAGRRAVVLGGRSAEVAGYGGSPTMVMNLVTTQDPHELTQAPGAPLPVRYQIWMAASQSHAVGA